MIFSVIWMMEPLLQLQQIEAESDVPEIVREAASFMEYALRRIPHELGESRRPKERLWYADVLGIYYRVDTDNSRVIVIDVAKAMRK